MNRRYPPGQRFRAEGPPIYANRTNRIDWKTQQGEPERETKYPYRTDVDTVSQHMAEVKAVPRLTQSELLDNIHRFQAGDREAGHQIVAAFLGYVWKVVRTRYSVAAQQRGIELRDLVQEGALALYKAIEGYDPDRGAAFVTYATLRIRSRVTRVLNEQTGAVYRPTYVMTRARIIFMEYCNALALYGHTGAVSRTANLLNIAEAEVETSLRLVDGDTSIDLVDPSVNSAEESSLFAHDGFEDELVSALDREALRDRAFESLDDSTDRTVVAMRYGFGLQGPETLQATGDTIALSRQGAKNRQDNALETIRTRIKELPTWHPRQPESQSPSIAPDTLSQPTPEFAAIDSGIVERVYVMVDDIISTETYQDFGRYPFSPRYRKQLIAYALVQVLGATKEQVADVVKTSIGTVTCYLRDIRALRTKGTQENAQLVATHLQTIKQALATAKASQISSRLRPDKKIRLPVAPKLSQPLREVRDRWQPRQRGIPVSESEISEAL